MIFQSLNNWFLSYKNLYAEGKDKIGKQYNLAMSLQNERGQLYKQDADSREVIYALKAF